MRSALIGHTGFVGGNLLRQYAFEDCYDSSNIGSIGAREYDLLVCAAPSAIKWLANKHPERDLEHVGKLIDDLAGCRTARFVLISTVDVYPSPVGVDELTPIVPDAAQPYGRHRFLLEQAVRERFPEALIVRLPQLFGAGLKKNFVYDMIHDHALHLTDSRSRLQFYDVGLLWDHVGRALEAGLDVINLGVEPATCGEVAREVFGVAFDHRTPAGPVHYDMRSVRLDILDRQSPYVLDRAACLARMRAFVADHGTSPPT